jgi:hypothetical protein
MIPPLNEKPCQSRRNSSSNTSFASNTIR